MYDLTTPSFDFVPDRGFAPQQAALYPQYGTSPDLVPIEQYQLYSNPPHHLYSTLSHSDQIIPPVLSYQFGQNFYPTPSPEYLPGRSTIDYGFGNAVSENFQSGSQLGYYQCDTANLQFGNSSTRYGHLEENS